MKRSEELKLAAQQEESEIKSYAYQCKALREQRSENFIQDWLPLLQSRFTVGINNHKYSIHAGSLGIIDYFPKGDKVLYRKKNTWIRPGLPWIIKHIAI